MRRTAAAAGALSRALALAMVLGLVLGGCSGGHRRAAGPPPEQPTRAVTYVAVGASESVGFGTADPLRQAWPRLFFQSALPRQATFVNVAVPGATVADALAHQLADALAQSPDLVTVWLNVNDLIALVPVAEFERQLGSLVHDLRRSGATKVLVANTPPLDHLPAYLACRRSPGTGGAPCRLGSATTRSVPPPELVNAGVDAYNAAIARVVAQQGAVAVDLHAAGLRARAEGREAELVSGDGFHPSEAGHRDVADAVAAALRASGGVG